VHWVYPYDKLRPANVLGTLTALELAADAKPKALVFVSSTSALDTAHYVRVSDERSGRPEAERGVPEDDDLEGARDTLKTGYGQTKWVAEKLLFEAGRRGMKGYIMRPGYIVGESQSAGSFRARCSKGALLSAYTVTNTDDFIWRLVKGCIQLRLVPDIHNGVNMVPVDHVSRALGAAALSAPSAGMEVLHMTAHPLPTFNGVLGALHAFGYATERAEYVLWRRRLEQHVLAAQDNALFPLLHFVLDDLPTSTKAPELNDARTAALLARHGLPAHATVDEDLMGKYVAWLVGAGFLPPPTMEQPERPLPVLDGAAARAVGRSGV
jgi:L-aminoadipate-semialdehyde dehydrogenase